MNPVSVLKGTNIEPMAGRETRRQDVAQTDCELISLLSYLEADNKRLWQAVQDLVVETVALRQTLKAAENRRCAPDVKPKARRSRRSPLPVAGTGAMDTERLVLLFDR
jgi:hypothetical protein